MSTSPSPFRGEWLRAAILLSVALVLTTIMAWPVLRSPHTAIFGNEVVGRHHDPFTVMQQWDNGQVPSPYRQPLTDDVGVALARMIGPVAAYNVVVLISFPLAAIATYLLARYLTVGAFGAAVAALVFAFSPAHLAHAAYHPHVAQTEWLPVYLLALFFCIDRPSVPSAALLVASVAALALSNFYGGLIGAVVTPVALAAYWAWSPRGGRMASSLSVPTLALMLACVAGAYFVRTSAPELWHSPEQFSFSDVDVSRYGASWLSYVLPPVEQPWLGSAVRRMWDHASVGPGLLEQQMSLGWGVMVLVGIALWMSVRRQIEARTSRCLLIVLILGAWAFVMSLAPSRNGAGESLMPAAVLHRVAPMFRSYARFGIGAGLAMAIAAGVGAEYLIGRARGAVGSMQMITRASLAVPLLLIALEFSPVPWRSRDVLPTMGHRWLADRSRAVRALDCAPPSLSEASVPWLMGASLSFMAAPFDGCADPDLAPKLAALGYTHLLVRANSPGMTGFSPRDGLTRLRSFSDSRVYGVNTLAPPVLVVARPGFFGLERDAQDSWRWMGQSGSWVLRNMVGQEATTSLEIELSAFAERRRVDVRYDGQPLATLMVEPDRRQYRIGPFAVPPGDHQLTFIAQEPAIHAVGVSTTDDNRPLTIMFGRWHWAAG